MNDSTKSTSAQTEIWEREAGPIEIAVYRKQNGEISVYIDTPDIEENENGPVLAVFLNDCDLWDNRP